MNNIKTVKFMFRGSDQNDLVGFDLKIPEGTKRKDLGKLIDKILYEFTGKDFNNMNWCVDEWLTNKKYPDGKHFFINWNNEWGFTSAYLYRVE